MSYTKSDHVLIAVKAALNSVPVVGGAIGSLISDYVPLSSQSSLEKATQFLKERLTGLEGRIDSESVNKDEFSELFKTCYLTIIRTTQESKLQAAAALLANLLLKKGDPDKMSYSELDHFSRSLDSLSIGAVRVLGVSYEMALKHGDLPRSSSYDFNFSDMREQVKDLDAPLLMGVMGELNAVNLFQIQRPQIATQDYSNYRITLTPLGISFVKRLLRLGT